MNALTRTHDMADPETLALFVAPLNDPASPADIADAERSIGHPLPGGYREFLALSDGYDDALGAGHLSLWPAGQLALRNEMFEVARKVAGLLLIGSNGGGTCYGIDWTGGAPQFVAVPFAALDRAQMRVLAGSFDGFVQAVARGEAG
jgi:hypothetical protein